MADEFLVKTFKPVGPKHLVEYKYQTETEDRLQQKLDRPAGANCRFDSFVKVDPGEKDLVWTEQVHTVYPQELIFFNVEAFNAIGTLEFSWRKEASAATRL